MTYTHTGANANLMKFQERQVNATQIKKNAVLRHVRKYIPMANFC